MACVWATFGIALGIITAPAPRNAVLLAGGIIAGLIVLTPIGVLLGLAGGRHTESLAGGSIGLIAGMILSPMAGTANPLIALSTGMIMGGLIGATLIGLFWRLPRWCAQLA